MTEQFHRVYVEGLQRMQPARKLARVSDLFLAGIALRVAGLKTQHPDWSRQQLEFEARRALRHAGT